jgi:hypothetical protein
VSAGAALRPGRRPTAGRTDQVSVEANAGLGRRSAGTERFSGELGGLEDLARRRVPDRSRHLHDGERLGRGRVNPPAEHVSDVCGIIRVAIEVLGGQLERGI